MDGYDRSDQRQQQADEERRMAHNLEALKRIDDAGLRQIAQDLALELGLLKEFNQQERRL